MPILSEQATIWLYTLNRRWSNASMMKHRNFDGHIISMKQSGTHWLKNMLSEVMIEIYDLPDMKHIQDDSIIGHTKSRPIYENIPQIVHSHGYPHALTLRLPLVYYPKYVLLLRDMKEGLVSHFERFRDYYGGVDFETFLKGDVRQKRFRSDIYSRIRFMNEWGDVLERQPEKLHVLKYEDIQENPTESLQGICDYFEIDGATRAIISTAIDKNTKEKMVAMSTNPDVETTVVRTAGKTARDYFDQKNTEFFESVCRKYLVHNFGYDYPTQK